MKKFLINFVVVLLLLIGTLYVAGYGYILKAVVVVYGTGHTTTFLDDLTIVQLLKVLLLSLGHFQRITTKYPKPPSYKMLTKNAER